MRDLATVSISLAGSLTGIVDAGAILRLDCLDAIDGSVTAHRDLGSGIVMDEIRAGHAIRGTIMAVHSSINRIIVYNTTPAPEGIQGNIYAKGINARIFDIYTTGPIGNASAEAVEIHAGNGIGEIRAVDEDDLGSVLVCDFKADIQANSNMADNPSTFPYVGNGDDGTLELLETEGNYIGGTIQAGNLPNLGFNRRAGIWVRGVVSAPIMIDLNVEFSNIVAAEFLEPITIGRTLKGAVVATGDTSATPPIAGEIDAITIGYAAFVPEEYEEYPPGMSGVSVDTNCLPIESLDAAVWFASQPPFDACIDLSAWDGAIRARGSIGSVTIHTLTQLHPSSVKAMVPRIEAPQIGTLQIDDMREGVVWSGLLDFVSGVEVLDNDFADVGTVSIGCMGPGADLWVAGAPTIDVAGEVRGEIHLKTIEPGQLVRIGGKLAAWGNGPGYDLPISPTPCSDAQYAISTFEEESPRDTVWPDELLRERGAVRILESNGLAGQVIINANADIELLLGEGWDGPVVVGDHLPSQSPPANAHTLDPAGTQPDDAPYYERLPTDPTPTEALGGGAVGLVPFNMHGLASNPPYDGITPPVRLVSAFNHTSIDILSHFDIDIEHYGPILATDGSVIVEFDENGTWTRLPSSVVTVETWLQNPTLGKRTLRIKGQGANMAGLFRFRPDTVFNADTLSSGPSFVYPWEYRIQLLPDCDEDGVADGEDPDTSSCTGGCCDLDSNDVVDVFDLLDYLDWWFQSAPQAEWDGVSGINVFDLLAFLDCWFQQGAGSCGP